MNTLAMFLVVASLGFDYGWERLSDGGMEYVVQLDPQTIEALRAGQAIRSVIPPAAGEIRAIRILAGRDQLRRDAPSEKLSPQNGGDARQGDLRRPSAPLALRPSATGSAAGPATFAELPSSKVDAMVGTAGDQKPKSKPKPWLPLTFALLGLFASLGANVYLGWIALEFRRRCCQAK